MVKEKSGGTSVPGGVPDGNFSKKAASYKGTRYDESVQGKPNKVSAKAEPSEKGGSKQE